jgi:hypothetical protein
MSKYQNEVGIGVEMRGGVLKSLRVVEKLAE